MLYLRHGCILIFVFWIMWSEFSMKQTIFPMIPVPTCSAAISFMWLLSVFLTKTTSIIPTSRMIRIWRQTHTQKKGKRQVSTFNNASTGPNFHTQYSFTANGCTMTTHPLVLGFWVQAPLDSFHPQLLLRRVHVEESFSAQVQFLKTTVQKQIDVLGITEVRRGWYLLLMFRKVLYDKLSLTPERTCQEVLRHSRATARGCCLETGHSRSMFLWKS